MNGSSGFQRRAGFVATDCFRASPVNLLRNQQEEVLGKDHTIKYTKINQNNHAILNSRRRDQEFTRTIEDIKKRKCTFYRMGFRSFEKQGQKKVFSDVLGLNSGQMKGTMFIGELWSNHEVGKYLRENKIYMNKLKLMDKMQVMKQEISNEERSDSESDLAMGSARTIGTSHHNIGSRAFLPQRVSNASSTGKMQFNRDLDNIKGDLKRLKRTTGHESLGGDIKNLERYKENMDKMERKYFLKMIDLD